MEKKPLVSLRNPAREEQAKQMEKHDLEMDSIVSGAPLGGAQTEKKLQANQEEEGPGSRVGDKGKVGRKKVFQSEMKNKAFNLPVELIEQLSTESNRIYLQENCSALGRAIFEAYFNMEEQARRAWLVSKGR